jgi:RNA polymerase sigma-70 factor (ECF subfamily)
MERPTDRTIIDREAIDRQAIDRLVLEHLPAALRLAMRLTRDPHEAEEVVQEALLRVLKGWKSYRAEAPFSTWMMRVVINAHRDRHRRERREEPATQEAASIAPGPADLAEAAETAERVSGEIDRLPSRQREVAVICLGESRSAREAAELLGMTENNLHATLHAVRKRLATALGLTIPRAKTTKRK